MPHTCICCHVKHKKGPKVSMFRFPANNEKRQQWLSALHLTEDMINEHSRVCSRHFLHGNPANPPLSNLGKRFASPMKVSSERNKRALNRVERSPSLLSPPSSAAKRLSLTPSSSRASSTSILSTGSTTDDDIRTVSVGESLLSGSDYGVHELPSTDDAMESGTALVARVELLEAEVQQLTSSVATRTETCYFRIEQISSDNSLVRFYTGFTSYLLLQNFYEFLGPSVHKLNYWGDMERKTNRRRKGMKLDPFNQFFLMLVKLRLNLRVTDLAIRFGLSSSLVSKYFITWVCFLYQHLKEIDWTPSVEQVATTLPCAFHEKYPTTFVIIDATEIFIQSPSDLFMQSSTWSNYKHHNTGKVLIGCTPNGAVSYVSELFVGSISDVELTKVSGFLNTLDGKTGVSVMADRGFTVKDMLAEKGVELNIPPFMEGRQQLPAEEIESGRRFAFTLKG